MSQNRNSSFLPVPARNKRSSVNAPFLSVPERHGRESINGRLSKNKGNEFIREIEIDS
jgi:hypothetical protein